MNPRRKAPNPERSEQRRQQILLAAAGCFERRGFHNASIAEISKVAGMSVGHIYHYFANKEAIIQAMVENRAEEIVQAMEEMRSREDVFAALVDCAGENLNRSTRASAAALKIEVLAEAARNPQILSTLHDADRISQTQLRETLLRVSPALGECPKALDAKANVIAALFDGLAIRTLVNPDFDRSAVIEALRLALRGVLNIS